MEEIESGFIDKKGRKLFIDDVISNGHIIWQILKREDEVLLLNCTHGYKHELTQEFFNDYNRIGKFDDLRELFECD